MSNVRFVIGSQNTGRRSSLGAGGFPKLINGNGTYLHAPTATAAAGFPLSNIMSPDRYVELFQHPGGLSNSPDGTSYNVDVDLGSIKTIVAYGLHGYAALGTFPSTVGVLAQLGATYDGTGAFVTPGTFAVGAGLRDQIAFITPLAARYWRFQFQNAGLAQPFSFSSLLIVPAFTDLGFLYARATEEIITPRSLVEGYGRVPLITRTGGAAPNFRRWTLEYPNNDVATRGIFDTLNAQANSFGFVTPEDKIYECVYDAETFARAHIFDPGGRYAFSPVIRSLP